MQHSISPSETSAQVHPVTSDDSPPVRRQDKPCVLLMGLRRYVLDGCESLRVRLGFVLMGSQEWKVLHIQRSISQDTRK